MIRDPRSNPQPGDELRGDGQSRRVIRLDGDRVLISGPQKRYWMRVDRWQAWCQKSGAVAKQEGSNVSL